MCHYSGRKQEKGVCYLFFFCLCRQTALIAAWLSKQMSPGHSPFGSLEGLHEALTTVCGVRSEHGLKWSDISQHCRETTHFGHALLLAVAAYSFARGEAEDTVREVQKVCGVGCEWYGIGVHAHCCHKVCILSMDFTSPYLIMLNILTNMRLSSSVACTTQKETHSSIG